MNDYLLPVLIGFAAAIIPIVIMTNAARSHVRLIENRLRIANDQRDAWKSKAEGYEIRLYNNSEQYRIAINDLITRHHADIRAKAKEYQDRLSRAGEELTGLESPCEITACRCDGNEFGSAS